MRDIEISVPMTDRWSEAAIAGLEGQVISLDIEGSFVARCRVLKAEPSPVGLADPSILLTLREERSTGSERPE